MKQKGFAIILVLATLVLLAMLSLTYIKLALIDRNIARNYMDNKRAKLIAQSGVDYAIARIQENLFDTSWQQAKSITINGVNTEYTESAGSTYGENRDVFKVEVRDSNSMLNVNDGLGNPRVSANLARIINNLAKVIDSTFPDIGFDIIWDNSLQKDKRPPGGYSNMSEVRSALVKVYGASGENYFEKIKPFITTHAWQDPNVANPVPLSKTVISAYGDPYVNYDTQIGVYRYGRGKDYNQNLISGSLKFAPDYLAGSVIGLISAIQAEYNKYGIYALDELNPQWIEIVSRSPVNINFADERIIKTLLKDLKGIFISERRSMLPYYFSGYLSIYFRDYSPTFWGNSYIDELGFLYCTQPINYNTALDLGLAKDIAMHIAGCRDKKSVTTGTVSIDYTDAGSLWFRGPFKSWRQFNAFVDNLVLSGLIEDTRELSEYELLPDVDSESGTFVFNYYNELVTASSSSPSRKIASQAIADVLKANFNPNLHLNETNPDANIATLVDKTDLIVNSTEFCFTPMGYFEIESKGMILKESGSDNIKISESKINAVVQLYDCYRETNQKQFLSHINNSTDYNNYIGTDSSPARTNNMRTIQIGPESEHIFDGSAPLAKGNEWGGYISLPTLKGPPSGDTELTFYSNFTNNFNADYHTWNLNSNVTTYNSADPTELKLGSIAEPAGAGPYVYGSRNRLARSFRKGDPITPKYYAVSDLRIDGAYVERHASIVYEVGYIYTYKSKGQTISEIRNILKSPGYWSYWVKPWFHPESTGMPRTFVSHTSIPSLFGSDSLHDILYFANYFFPSHFVNNNPNNTYYATLDPLLYEANNPFYSSQNPGQVNLGNHFYKAMSLVFGHAITCSDENQGAALIGGGRGVSTPILNHSYHSDNKPFYLKSGHWTHVVCKWDIENATQADQVKLLVNGTELTNFRLTIDHTESGIITMDQFFNSSRTIRLGEPIIRSAASLPYPTDVQRNWTADATIDEFYIFSGTTLQKAKDIYFNSRYYRPPANTSYFISQELQLNKENKGPNYSTITDPEGSIPPASILVAQKTKIIGLSWTWYGEDTDTINVADPDKLGKPILKDCRVYEDTQSIDNAKKAATFKYPVVKIKLIKKDMITGVETEFPDEYKDDGYSVLNVELADSDSIRYKVIIDIPSIAPDTVLLYSPVFDDITIYYTSGVEFLSYMGLGE